MYKLKTPIYTTNIKVCFQKSVRMSIYYVQIKQNTLQISFSNIIYK